MPPTLRTVVRRMNLRPLAGTSAPGVLEAAVRWVAVSELADPTPYLEGGELLLTTGMRMEGDQSHYVARLVARGVAGLGFGVGVSHEETPPALVTAAERAGLPLLEVPRETPFIAVGKAVSELLAAEQYEEISRAFAAQGRLTRAALRPEGMHAVIDRLAREVDGWAALLDESGEVRHATRGARPEAVTHELIRLRGGRPAEPSGRRAEMTGPRVEPSGRRGETVARPVEARRGEPGGRGGERVPSSLALSAPGEHIVVLPLGGGGRPRGFFAVGARHAFTPVAHTVINAAGSLLTLAMEQGRTRLTAERRVRAAVLELLLAGDRERARVVLEPLGGRLPEEPIVVLAAPPEAMEALEPHGFTALHDGPPPVPERGRASAGASAETPGGAPGRASAGAAAGAAGRTAGQTGQVVVALVAHEVAHGVAQEVAGGAEVPVGLSRPAGYAVTGLSTALEQARRALEAARSRDAAAREAEGPGAGGAGDRAKGGSQGGSQGGAGRGGRGGAGQGAGSVVGFDELAGQGLLGLLDPAAAQAFSAAVLAPLTAYGSRADLVASLRAYLEGNGHWETAAQRLGVHRHTLRYRMRRVSDLLGRDLDDPGVRAELWLALEAAGHPAISASPPDSSR
ncbi:PucR family transcriptional regulator [Nonomuraea fuscirosea]|uniref:PucR family transcriptional regulator n=1 Tax=Nonomuraea fuscirosea TaxID=1291556 RepID=UPI0033EDD4D3